MSEENITQSIADGPSKVNDSLKNLNDSSKNDMQSNQNLQNEPIEFDWQFYLELYPDLAVLSNEEQAYEHWVNLGQQEGRIGNKSQFTEICLKNLPEDFDWQEYLALNSDLQSLMQNDLQAIYHFITIGRNEGRLYKLNLQSSVNNSKQNQKTKLFKNTFQLVKISDLELYPQNPDIVLGCCLDYPETGLFYLNKNMLCGFWGWIVGNNSLINTVEISCNDQVLLTLSVDEERPDIQEIFPHKSWSLYSGFSASISISQLLSLPLNHILIRAFLDKSNSNNIFTIASFNIQVVDVDPPFNHQKNIKTFKDKILITETLDQRLKNLLEFNKQSSIKSYYDGTIDKVSNELINGWAVDKNDLDKPILLDVYCNDIFTTTCIANNFRGDLAKKFNSDGYHGFVVEIPKNFRFNNLLSVSIKFRDNQVNLRKSPINCLLGSSGKKHNLFVKNFAYLSQKQIYNQISYINQKSQLDLPKVAIIIINLNGELLLNKLFSSFIIANTYSNIEIIVVDHNSEDQSLEVCNTWSKKLPIKVLPRQGNYSFANSNNFAVEHTDAPLLFFLNNDILFHNETINSQDIVPELVNLMQGQIITKDNLFCQDVIPKLIELIQDENIGIVGLKLLDNLIDNSNPNLATQHLGIQFDFYQQQNLFRPFDVRKSEQLQCIKFNAWYVPATTGAAFMCRRNDFIAVGGFEEGYFYGLEDVDLCLLFQESLNKKVICANNLALWHHRGFTRFNKQSEVFARKQKDNLKLLEKRFGYQIRRKYLSESLSNSFFWTSSPLRVGFAVTDARLEAGAGDYFTAMELGEQFVREFGWEVFYLTKNADWYNAQSLDVLIVMREDYNLERLTNCKPSLVKVIWVRNWFDRFLSRAWIGNYDLVWASSQKAVDYLTKNISKPVTLIPIATNPARFESAEFDPYLYSDYCFTGSYWGVEREIIDCLQPENLPFKFSIYGHNWQNSEKLSPYYRGALPYSEMPYVYASTKIVIDDANIVTKEWGSVNSRVFDAICAGALVITNGELGNQSLFNGLLPTYNSVDSLQENLIYFLINEEKRLELVNHLQTIIKENHTYQHRAKVVWDVLQYKMSETFRISIKIGVPNKEVINEWGDYHFALGMKRAFEKLGHSVRIDILPDWYNSNTYGDDVTIVLRGLSQYEPKPHHINIMWNISHPDKISNYEYDLYDHVFVASSSYAELLSQDVQVPVECLLQCTDPDVFYSGSDLEQEIDFSDILFVGNSRKVYRQIVKDAIDIDIKLDVYGTNWEFFIPVEYIKGENIPNNTLRNYYSNCAILLNDHWETMKQRGFISNRLFDATACGAFVISDAVVGIEAIFGDNVKIYHTPEELKVLIQEYGTKAEKMFEQRINFADYIRKNHSFTNRVEQIMQVINKLHKQKMSNNQVIINN